MKHRSPVIALVAALLALAAHPSFAAADNAAAPQGGKAAASAPGRVAAVSSKPVDINTASRIELKKLPGISDAVAGRIIAGRPYASKANLVSRNIVDAAVYDGIRRSIVARQPYKDAARNAAIYVDKK